ncbi:MAG TPA: hypothetical protein VGN78_05405 [Solirubrobacteraceae bacterium]|nr:hypothetical protein [Solirubrobacteraceae bacterium]
MERNGANEPDGPPEAVGDLPAAIAGRVEQIVRAAEREAAAVQQDLAAQREAAEADIERYLAESRRRADVQAGERTQQVRDLTGELVGRAEAVARELEALLVALKRTTAALETGEAEARPEVPPPPPAPAGDPAAPGRRDLSAVRLVAIEMAVAGRSREQVDEHLREAFDVNDTRALLDDVFGAVRTGR